MVKALIEAVGGVLAKAKEAAIRAASAASKKAIGAAASSKKFRSLVAKSSKFKAFLGIAFAFYHSNRAVFSRFKKVITTSVSVQNPPIAFFLNKDILKSVAASVILKRIKMVIVILLTLRIIPSFWKASKKIKPIHCVGLSCILEPKIRRPMRGVRQYSFLELAEIRRAIVQSSVLEAEFRGALLYDRALRYDRILHLPEKKMEGYYLSKPPHSTPLGRGMVQLKLAKLFHERLRRPRSINFYFAMRKTKKKLKGCFGPKDVLTESRQHKNPRRPRLRRHGPIFLAGNFTVAFPCCYIQIAVF
ncbi:hypothetical protein H6P81_008893 [Aristolochia fimbriata]|uniref:Uncharacterized protein n=1 Tax=Aristolochia fimbriata TaxID=158543 RepID=A0AAV7EJA9_ARIFI|nr:hypothetical protein H6P81_008893 [Aristolochia fimbriata]